MAASTRKRDKSATLEMESETSETGWKKYRFILKGKYLYYYTPHKRVRHSQTNFMSVKTP